MNPDLQQQDMKQKAFETEDPNDSAGGDESDNEKPARRSGRRKIKIEYIEDKNRRHITFSKRKAGIMKKAYELSTLTGTQVLLLVVSETGLVYTFTTVKLQPIVTKPEGKNLIQACLNAPDPMAAEQSGGDASYGNTSPQVDEKKPIYEDKAESSGAAATVPAPSIPPPSQQPQPQQQPPQQQQQQQQQQNAAYGSNGGNGSNNNSNVYQSQQGYPPQPTAGGYSGHPGYMGAPQNYPPSQQPQQSQQQQPGNAYGQMPPQPGFYGNQQQQPHYMPHQQQPQGYWQQQQQQPQQQPGNLPRQPQDQSPIIDDKQRRGVKK